MMIEGETCHIFGGSGVDGVFPAAGTLRVGQGRLFPHLAPVFPAAGANLLLLVQAIVFNYSFNAVQTFMMRYAFPVFLLFCYVLPLLSLLLRKKPKAGRGTPGQNAKAARKKTARRRAARIARLLRRQERREHE